MTVSVTTPLTEQETRRLVSSNINAGFDFLEFLLDHPEEIEKIPDGSTVIIPTGDAWVDEQNKVLAEQAQANGETVYRVPALHLANFPR
ncbi:hypothetical protein [Synechococcus sp. PCC 6312]|uniref:hypothetical protein n=1 Tax=Synechococcus sp. (strain ATCC 27167 / PCC 6312) TaxID=195253 RepID=UPI00029ECF9D|nr:hypothetical protein [Synechococcus sp. PCC 6312]AFY62804.1 hypothetical protein Syn6312_3794 [Synechococcus sp. PCC 6312]